MPINAQIPLQVQRPKIVGPAELLSLKDLSTRAQANEFNLQQAKMDAPLKRRLSEIGMMKDQQALEAEIIKRREEYSKEVNEYAYNKALQIRATGASQQAIDQAVREAYMEKLDEQDRSGKLRMAGIDDQMLGQARTKVPTFKDIEAKVLTTEQALERADYSQTAQQIPLSQIGQAPMEPPVIPPMGVEADLLGSGPIRQPATNVPLETPPIEVKGQATANSPEGMRYEAERLDKLGTKAASAKADKLRDAADQLSRLGIEEQKLEDAQKARERDQWELVSGAPGVTRNKLTNEFQMDGKRIDAKQVQAIAEKNRKAGATNVNVNSMTPENAAKTELLNQGISDMVEFKEMVMPNGQINRTIIAGLNVPGFAGLPGTDSRTAYSLIYNAVEAKLRAESGAAVPDAEVKRIAARFIPSIIDSDATIKSKVERMEAFLRGSFERIKGAGVSTEDKKNVKTTPKRRASDKANIINFEDLE